METKKSDTQYFTNVRIVCCNYLIKDGILQPIILATPDTTISLSEIRKILDAMKGEKKDINDYNKLYDDTLFIQFNNTNNLLLQYISIDKNSNDLDITEQFNKNFNDICSKTLTVSAISEPNPHHQAK